LTQAQGHIIVRADLLRSMLHQIHDDATSEQLRCVVRHTFIDVRCTEPEGSVTLTRQNSDPTFTTPTHKGAKQPMPGVDENKDEFDACSTCTEREMDVEAASTTGALSNGDAKSQSSRGSWASRLSNRSKSSIGSTASKFFQFQSSKDSGSKSIQTPFVVGMQCEATSPIIVRKGEALESDFVVELPIGTCLEILEMGEIPRRARICAGDVAGWISVMTRLKQPLITQRMGSVASTVSQFEVGGEHEVITAVTLRAEESLDSEVITELKPGTIVKIKELGKINNRRGRVESKGTPDGWISFTTRQGDLLIGKVTAKASTKKMRAALFGPSSSKIKKILESARDGDLDSIKKCMEPTSTGFMSKWVRPDLNCSDIRGKTALIYASAFGHQHIVDYLLDKRPKNEVDVNLTDDTQKSALHHATKRARKTRGKPQVGIVKALVDNGAQVDAADHNGCTPLIFAVGNNDDGVAEVLLDAGANVNLKDHQGHTAWYYARHFGYHDLAEVLEARGATTVQSESEYEEDDADADAEQEEECEEEGEDAEDAVETPQGELRMAHVTTDTSAIGASPDIWQAQDGVFAAMLEQDQRNEGGGTPDAFEADNLGTKPLFPPRPTSTLSKDAPPFSLLSVEPMQVTQPQQSQGTPPGNWQQQCLLPTDASARVAAVPYVPPEAQQYSTMMMDSYEPGMSSMSQYEQVLPQDNSWCQAQAGYGKEVYTKDRCNSPARDYQAMTVPGLSYEVAEPDNRTTLMVGNLQHDLTQVKFVQDLLESGYRGLFDFVYMPMNFRESGNFGYAFVNFVSHHVAFNLMDQMKNPKYAENPSIQKWNIVWSNCQGFDANVDRYRNSPLMHEVVPMDCKPTVYNHIGMQVPFPAPTKTISKPRIHRSGPKPEKAAASATAQPASESSLRQTQSQWHS